MSTVYLNGVNINRYVSEGSLQIDDSIGERSTCQFIVQCPAGTLDVSVGARIAVYTDNKIIFSGTIDSIDKEEIPGSNPPYLQYSVQCADHHQICDRRIVSEAYENMAAGDIVQSLIQNYLASEGIIGNPAEPTFTRPSVAYLTDGTQVAANQPRFEQGKFGKAVMVEEGTTNLISNPSFERDSNGDGLADSWSSVNSHGATCSYQRVIGKYGSYAQRMTKTDWITQTEDKYSAFRQTVTGLTAGTTYVLSVDYKLTMTSSSVDAPRSVGVVIYHIDSSNSLKNATISWGWAPTAEWIRKTVTFTLATGTDRIEIELRMSCNGTVDWDGVQLEAKPYPTSFIDGTRSPESLTIPTAGVLNPQEGTVEFWWNPLAKTPGTYPSLISTGKWTSDRSQDWLAIYWGSGWNNANEVRFGLVNGSTKQGYDQAITLNPSPFTWYFIAFKWDFANTQTAKLLIYKPDGSLLTKQVSLAGIPAPSFAGWDKFYVLQTWDNGPNRANSLIDDLRISNRARSDEEILAAYQSGQPLPVDEWTTCKLDFDGNISNSAISIQNGPIIQQAVFNYVPATQCFDKLADLAGFTWWIDSYKRLHFCDRALYQAPFVIDEQSKIMRPKLSSNRDNYRNRQYIRAGKGTTDPQTETFKGNGVQKTFTVGFPIAKVPTIKVNGVTQTVGIKGVDTGKQWYWNKGDAVITQDEEAMPLSETDTLQVTYQGFYDIIVLTDDYPAVLERQSVEGGTGLYEAVNEEPYAETSEAAFQSANALLKKYAKLGEVLSFGTLMPGLRAGQLLQVNLPILGAVGEYLIRKVQYRDMLGDKYDYIFSVEAVSCFAAETWTKFFKSNLGQPKTYVIRENIQEQEVLIRLVQQSEHTSWTEEVVQTVLACPIPSDELYPSDTLYPC